MSLHALTLPHATRRSSTRVHAPRRVGDSGYRMALAFLGFLLLFAIIILKTKTAQHYWVEPALLLYTVFVTSFELSRLVGAIMFKRVDEKLQEHIESISDGTLYEPTVSFVIPCKNEEPSIGMTIDNCFRVKYPTQKLEVIVINDGSTDGTRAELLKAQQRHSALKIIDWEQNRGKRHAMAAGFRQATGDIIIQLDSDSWIKPEDFRTFIEPFRDPEIGAVCAHADPANAEHNWLTKMQAAYYFLSFRILKAAESTFMTVFCCSGCSSAYRRSILVPHLDEWENERFLGLPVTWGDDRALTNWVLRLNYRTIYTDRVQAYTICPDNFRVFLKQQVRWKKGWLVNSIFASKFIWKKHPFVALTYFFPLVLITIITPFVAVKALIVDPVIHQRFPIYYMLGVLLVAGLITVYYRYVARENKYWPYVMAWSALNMFVLSFILLYAVGSIQNRKWGTR
jgi:hyaluronan synthase